MADPAGDPSGVPETLKPTSVWLGFSMMCLGMFMAILDVQVVATSLPAIQGALNIAPDQMSWVQTAYLTAEVIAIPLTGMLTRILGMRWLFVAALSIFTLASIGCAASAGFDSLIIWRVVQGFAGGVLIPCVFAAVFLLFPERQQGVATTIAGVVAVLAPTVGPVVGGWITQTYNWHWLFLINVTPGLVAGLTALLLLPRAALDLTLVRRIDIASLLLMGAALAGLEIGLKQAPHHGWLSASCLGPIAIFGVCGTGFVIRSLKIRHPIVDLRTLKRPTFTVGCLLSFALGVGLFGSVYMMPVFLAFVRGHNPLEIGQIMLVTGLAQLATAPLAVALERRVDPRLLSAAGFVLFAIGLGLSARQTEDTDFAGMLWPQVIRGAAIMFCLLPPTRLALGRLAKVDIPDASGLFNLMRNLGGAIGLALIDTVIYGRSPIHAAAIAGRLKTGDVDTAKAVGIPVHMFLAQVGQPIGAETEAMVRPLVAKLALTQALNEGWVVVSVLTFLSLLSLLMILGERCRGD